MKKILILVLALASLTTGCVVTDDTRPDGCYTTVHATHGVVTSPVFTRGFRFAVVEFDSTRTELNLWVESLSGIQMSDPVTIEATGGEAVLIPSDWATEHSSRYLHWVVAAADGVDDPGHEVVLFYLYSDDPLCD